MAREAPAAELRLAVHPRLARVADPEDALHRDARDALGEALGERLAALGLPGAPQVEIVVADDPPQWGAIAVNGSVCRYGAETGRGARVAALGSHDAESDSDVLAWLERAVEGDPALAVEFLRHAVGAVVSDHAAALVRPAVAAAYAGALGRPADAERLEMCLRHVVDLRVSVAATDVVAGVLDEHRAEGPLECAEALLSALRPRELELRLSERLLRELTGGQFAGLLDVLRSGVLYDLGIEVPVLRAARAPLPGSCFALDVNHLPLLARAGLPPGECLVNTALPGVQVLGLMDNPGSALANARIAGDDATAAGEAGLTTWTAAEYVYLALAEDLGRYARCLVDTEATERLLEWLAPALVRQKDARISTAHLTGVIRVLVAERESARDLAAIVERLLDADEAAAAEVGEWVRAGLAPAIATRRAQGTGTVVAYLFDQRAEELLVADGRPTDAAVDEVLRAIRGELALLPPTVGLPCLLTTAEVRPRLRDAVRDEFPRLAVLSYDDLPSTVNVQPIARIALEGAAP